MSQWLDFGRYLRTQRERRGLSVDEVARAMKISPTLIGALEDGQAERFPERVFMLNYVRSYAESVGLPPDDAVAKFEAVPGAPHATQFEPTALERARRERAATVLWLVLAALTLGGIGLWFESASATAARIVNR